MRNSGIQQIISIDDTLAANFITAQIKQSGA